MPKAKERDGFEAEMHAMKVCHKALDGLSINAQRRVLEHLTGTLRYEANQMYAGFAMAGKSAASPNDNGHND